MSLFVGGTGSANELDDYEVGTFTPTWSFSPNQASGVSYAYNNGNYIKIGSFVYISVRIPVSYTHLTLPTKRIV